MKINTTDPLTKLLNQSLAMIVLMVGLTTVSFAGDENNRSIKSKNGITAYTWNSNPSATQAILSTSSYTFNSGRSVSRMRPSKGVYQVQFDGLNCNRGQFTVNAYGGTEFKMCRIGSWSGKKSCEVSVYCFNSSGKPLDSEFNLLFID